MNDLYKMELHEVINYDAFEVHRVPGGWIYRFFQIRKSSCVASPAVDSVFVPINDEMKELKGKQINFPVYVA